MVEESVDRMKTEAGDVTLLAVGGGAFLIPDRLEGVSEVVRVPHGDCANAVGAAIAQVSGEVDQVFRDLTREAAIAAAQELAGGARGRGRRRSGDARRDRDRGHPDRLSARQRAAHQGALRRRRRGALTVRAR